MPKYAIITRVELHKDEARKQPHSPNAAEYDTLHAEMHARDYRRFYESVSGKKKKLPPGEYCIDQTGKDGDEARDLAIDKAKAAATIATSAKRFSLLASGGGNVKGYQLEEITKDPDA